ncbi:histone-fold-containing protein [Sphaerulina musiva SO2202]|uniref:Histone H4 n=1 Tax=Sphaerulina musiva (strain SO2202) TaxID=692275 RepID=N1QET3_SPHMS|nr:histone-fold-containing protein [Sphaerulina musiva SO2202]EMF09522.1 histone-fold-containing protein [Sphaerulina musiva SO2202]
MGWRPRSPSAAPSSTSSSIARASPAPAPARSARKTAGPSGLGLGLGRKPARRHRKILKENIQGVTKPAIRRLARRGGVKRISGDIYDPIRQSLKDYLTKALEKIIAITEYRNAKTVTALDVVFGLRQIGQTLYGFGVGNSK